MPAREPLASTVSKRISEAGAVFCGEMQMACRPLHATADATLPRGPSPHSDDRPSNPRIHSPGSPMPSVASRVGGSTSTRPECCPPTELLPPVLHWAWRDQAPPEIGTYREHRLDKPLGGRKRQECVRGKTRFASQQKGQVASSQLCGQQPTLPAEVSPTPRSVVSETYQCSKTRSSCSRAVARQQATQKPMSRDPCSCPCCCAGCVSCVPRHRLRRDRRAGRRRRACEPLSRQLAPARLAGPNELGAPKEEPNF